MRENFGWFKKNREKQKLMSEVVEIARTQVEALKGTDFWIGSGINRAKKMHFTYWEFSPKNENGRASLTEKEVIESLGIEPDLKIEEAPRQEHVGGIIKGIWPTNVPGLYYVKDSSYGYFEIIEEDIKSEKIVDKEKLGAWNKRVWNQADANKKAHKELSKEFGEKPGKY